MRKFIVIPEALKAGPDGRGTDEPSFVYCQVLDFTLRLARPEDEVYLAPANAFGGPLTEEEAARRYLEARNARLCIRYPGANLPVDPDRPRYIDTWDNARLLRAALGPPAADRFELVCSQHHARRAAWCFQRTGFHLAAVHRVPYVLEPEPVPRRVFYYRHPLLYRLYEAAALLRDVIMAATGLRR